MTLQQFCAAHGVKTQSALDTLRPKYHREMNWRAMQALRRYSEWLHEQGIEYPGR